MLDKMYDNSYDILFHGATRLVLLLVLGGQVVVVVSCSVGILTECADEDREDWDAVWGKSTHLENQ